MKKLLLGGAAALSFTMMLAAPLPAQSVKAGVEAWQKGDYSAAAATWRVLAARGDADAAFNLGQAYRLGKGVPLDLARAQDLYEQAARKNHIDAAATLGILLFQNGNRIAALRWLKKGAEGGEARAMLLYGTALYNGEGTSPDAVRAYAFISRAAAQGLAAGKASLADLDQAMPIEQRRQGLVLAQAMAAATPLAKPFAPASGKSPAPALVKTATVARAKPSAPIGVPAPAALAATGNWRIQLGAFGQRVTAEALFAKVHARLGARQAYYIPIGKVVRLQVGPFDSRASASAACVALGGGCFAVPAR